MEMDTNNVTTMYDTINFILFKDDYPDIDFIATLPQYLTSITSNGFGTQGRFITGYLDSYLVSINGYRVKVQNSSLARYINHDNQMGMSLQQTRRALEKMSEQLHLNMDNAKITRIDLGKNIITKYPPNTYIQYLGESIGYTRLENGEGLYFKNSLRELVFYDKLKEQKNKRKDIQTIFKGTNLLRYEMRLKNHLEKELNQPRVIASLLYDEKFYIGLAKFWRDEYLKISKKSNKTNGIIPTASTRDLMANLARLSIREIGDDVLLKMISQWQEQELLTKKQVCDHRKFIRDAVKNEMRSSGNEFIEELDKKVKESVRFFI